MSTDSQEGRNEVKSVAIYKEILRNPTYRSPNNQQLERSQLLWAHSETRAKKETTRESVCCGPSKTQCHVAVPSTVNNIKERILTKVQSH